MEHKIKGFCWDKEGKKPASVERHKGVKGVKDPKLQLN